ncbi:hypothetical protein AAFF_G00315190 [Aldrovandia affinis]|uniref:Uncharacterized protein n=1 Tax=Aldrovandia affinis TaxID=143900 RepID=A0AAD7WRC7_9TELE|nr:hypothetical protein AAFF_G00315190 [Aldrovandia affinis]
MRKRGWTQARTRQVESQPGTVGYMIKKYFELEPLARGKQWILEGSTVYNMEAVKESFSQLIGLLEEKEMEPGII